MNFEQNENQGMIAQMEKDFAEKEIKPNMKNWDDHEIFPEETMKKLGELGLLGIFIPEEYGGQGFGYAEYATALMELGKVCGGIGLSVAAHNSLCTGHIFYHGNVDQKKLTLIIQEVNKVLKVERIASINKQIKKPFSLA